MLGIGSHSLHTFGSGRVFSTDTADYWTPSKRARDTDGIRAGQERNVPESGFAVGKLYGNREAAVRSSRNPGLPQNGTEE